MSNKKVKDSKKELRSKIRDAEFGKRVKAVRKHLNLKQSEMCDKLNISIPNLSDIETAKTFPCYEFFYLIAEKFNVNLYYLLFGTGEMIGKPEVIDPNAPKPQKNENERKYIVDNPDVREFLDNFTGSKVLQYRLMSEYMKIMNTEGNAIMADYVKKDQPPGADGKS